MEPGIAHLPTQHFGHARYPARKRTSDEHPGPNLSTAVSKKRTSDEHPGPNLLTAVSSVVVVCLERIQEAATHCSLAELNLRL